MVLALVQALVQVPVRALVSGWVAVQGALLLSAQAVGSDALAVCVGVN